MLSWRVLYGLAAPNYGPLATPENLLRVAHYAERRGLDSIFVADHVAVPDRVGSIYPYDRAVRPAPANLRQLEHFYDLLLLHLRHARNIDELIADLDRLVDEVLA